MGDRRPGRSEGEAQRERCRGAVAGALALAFFGVVVGGVAAWFAWRLVSRGEVLVGISVAGLATVGGLALGSTVRGRLGLIEKLGDRRWRVRWYKGE